MKWNPYLNAVGASAYIWAIVLLLNHIARLHHDTPDNAVGTAAALSLMVLSASVMAFLFFYRPVMLLIENKKQEAISFFFKTVLTFALITSLAVFTLV